MSNDFDPDKFLADDDFNPDEFLADNDFNPDDVLLETSPAPIEEEPSSLQTLGETALDTAVGVAKGTGIGKPIAGLVGALMPDPTADVDAQLRAEGFDLGEEKSLEDKYYEGQDLYQKEVEASQERSPIMSTVGQVAGGITSAHLTGNALAPLASTGKAKQILDTYSKLKNSGHIGKVAATALAAGASTAAYDVAEGRSKILKGMKDTLVDQELDELIRAKDELSDSFVNGMLVGGGLSSIGSVAGGVANRLVPRFKNAFKAGWEGTIVHGEENLLKIEDQLTKFANKFKTRINKMAETTGKEIEDTLTNQGNVVNLSEFFEETVSKLEKMAKSDEFSILGKDLKKINKLIAKYKKSGDLEKTDFRNAKRIMDEFKDMATDYNGKSPLKNNEIKKFARETSKNLNTHVKQYFPGMEDIYEKYSKIKDIQDFGKFTRQFKKSKEYSDTESIKELLRNASDLTKGSGKKAHGRLKEILKNYEDIAGPDATQKFRARAKQIQTDVDLANIANKDIQGIGGVIRTGGVTGLNYAGKLSGFLMKPDSMINVAKKLSNMPNEKYRPIAQKFATELESLASLPKTTREAKIFGLVQQPIFRTLMDELGTTAVDDMVDEAESTPERIHDTSKDHSENIDQTVESQRELLSKVDQINSIGRDPATLSDDLKESEGHASLAPRHRRIKGSSDFGTYKDQRGFLTTGYGHLITSEEKKNPELMEYYQNLTEEQADQLLMEDVKKHNNELDRYFKRIGFDSSSLKPRQLEALQDMNFNMGITKFRNFSRMIKALKNGDLEGVVNQMKNSSWYRNRSTRARARNVINKFRE